MSPTNQYNANAQQHPSNGSIIPHSTRRNNAAAYSSSTSESAKSNSSTRCNYEPGTGAHFMAQSGWSNRDHRYGRPRQHSVGPVPTPTSAAFPIFTPAPRQTHQHPLQQQRHGARGPIVPEEPPHQITFSNGPNYKRIYLIALVLVSLLLLSLIIVIVVLLFSKVLVFVGFSSSSASQQPSNVPSSPSLPTFPTPPEQPRLVTRTFECELYVLDQANQAYNDPNSFEQFQAQSIIQNALLSVLEHSSLRDMRPNIVVEGVENSGADLHVVFRLSIVMVEQQNNSFQEQSVRNVLLSEAGLLEAYLNRTSIDRSRISAKRTN